MPRVLGEVTTQRDTLLAFCRYCIISSYMLASFRVAGVCFCFFWDCKYGRRYPLSPCVVYIVHFGRRFFLSFGVENPSLSLFVLFLSSFSQFFNSICPLHVFTFLYFV